MQPAHSKIILRAALAVLAVLAAPVSRAYDDTLDAKVIRCQAVQCEVSQGVMSGMPQLNFKTQGLQALAGTTVRLRLEGAGAADFQPRTLLVSGNGQLVGSLAAYRLNPGSYRFVIESDRAVASGEFEVTSRQRTAAAASAGRAASAGTASPARAQPASSSALVGSWYGIASTAGMIELRADGSYLHNGRPGGRWQTVPGGVQFTGRLAAWNGGRATLKDDVLEFAWTNAEGWKNWFVFQHSR